MMKKFIKALKYEFGQLRRIIRSRAFISKGDKEDIINRFHKLYYDSALLGGTHKNTFFLGIPTRKCPLDVWLYQEIIYRLRPDVIIECGTSHGGSALYLASIFDLVDHGEIITIDIEDLPRPSHKRIKYLLGSSVSKEIVDKVKEMIKGKEKVMVILDSDHSKDHVFKELEIYNKFVTKGQYLIIEDTNVNGHPVYLEHGPGPMEALDEFLKNNNDFVESEEGSKFLLTFNPRGYLIKK
jgi:cephalosporin hydroxylase